MLYAFTVSLVLHFAGVPFVPQVRASTEGVEPTPMRFPPLIKVRRLRIPPTPQPPKRPVVAHRSAHAGIHLPHQRSAAVAQAGPPENGRVSAGPASGGWIGNDATPDSGPTVAPATPLPRPVCSTPFADARTIEQFVPEMPEMAREEGLSGTAEVKVTLSAQGTVTDATIYLSTGSPVLDAAAVDAARRTTYAPKIVDCETVAGEYLFRVEFSAQQP